MPLLCSTALCPLSTVRCPLSSGPSCSGGGGGGCAVVVMGLALCRLAMSATLGAYARSQVRVLPRLRQTQGSHGAAALAIARTQAPDNEYLGLHASPAW